MLVISPVARKNGGSRPTGVGLGPTPAGSALGDHVEQGPASSNLGSPFMSLLEQLTQDWNRGQAQAIEDYLSQLDPANTSGAVELIYSEFCLAEAAGWEPDPSAYIARFPRYGEQLGRLLELHGACSPSLIDRWVGCTPENYTLPEVGDSIGPYVLRRELGRGSFARVFLAEQADLENRLVVAKVSTRATREPWLLAKSRHAHIVDILSHAEVDDGAFQLICMPFWGGATLSAVLEHRRARGRAPRSGSDLLADLDAVAAPEFPTVHPARPAREILRGLSYNAALAWVAARLAEALSHAFSRGVAHGDVKPSNILLAADGSPMLLDFNLAHDSSPGIAYLQDRGGTLPYMPPERLLALAEIAGSGLESPRKLQSAPARDGLELSFDFLNTTSTDRTSLDIEPESVPTGSTEDFPSNADIAPHRADIYSLGVVLLEGFTGRMPEAVGISDTLAHLSGPERIKVTAIAYATARNRGAAALIRDFEAGAGRQIDPGVRSILERCLEPDPDRRYRDASELAEDLDRWRTGRRLAFAAEPFLSVTIPRWIHARRRSLAAAALALSVLCATSAVAILKLDMTHLTNGNLKLSSFLDAIESGVYGFQRPHNEGIFNRDDSAVFETAGRVLKEYNVLDSADWRQRDHVRYLSTRDREELELWICEQAFRFARLLAARPDSPSDWLRALTVLDNASSHRLIIAFTPLEKTLRANLEKTSRNYLEAVSEPKSPAPLWLEKYLLGVVSETQSDFSQSGYANLRPSGDTHATLAATSEALHHYESMLELRPDSYWGHYRAAVAAQGLEKMTDTVVHLQVCLEKRPNNPVLRGQLAGCLARLRQFEDALQQCNLAIEGSPDFAEFYRTRAFIKVELGDSAGLAEDLRSFEIRSGILPRTVLGDALFTVAHPFSTSTVSSAELAPQIKRLPQPLRTVDPTELDARACLAKAIQLEIHDFDVANSEVNKILILDPDHLMALAFRATQAAENADFDAVRRDLDRLFNHEDLYDYTHEHPDLVRQLTIISSHLLLRRQTELAAVAASHAREVSRQLKDRWKQSAHVGLSHYALARVYAVMGQNDQDSLDRCGRELYRAIRANDDFRAFFLKDKYFTKVRGRILEQLPRIELMLEANATPRTRVVARSGNASIIASNSEPTDSLNAASTGSIKPFDH